MDSSKIDDALICLRDLVTFSRITKVIEVKIKRFCELFKQICKNSTYLYGTECLEKLYFNTIGGFLFTTSIVDFKDSKSLHGMIRLSMHI